MLVCSPKMPGYHRVDHVKHTVRIDREGVGTLVGVHLISDSEGVLHEVTPMFDIAVVVPATNVR